MEGRDIREIAMLPNWLFEKQSERYMRIIRWQSLIIVFLIICIVGYVIYSNQFETVSYSQEAEASFNGSVNMNGSGGLTVNGGESKTDSYSQTKKSEDSEMHSGQDLQ